MLALIVTKSRIVITIYSAAISIIGCAIYLLLDAPDVAMTEAAINACLSTVILLEFVNHKTNTNETSTNEIGYALHDRQNDKKILGIIAACSTFAILFYFGYKMDDFGTSVAAIDSGAVNHYIENSYSEIGISNYVTSILASYRGFDTLCETVVIFLSSVGAMIISTPNMRDHFISDDEHKCIGFSHTIKPVTIFLVPLILLYGLYIHLFGDFSPGGGFQAGAIITSGLIAYDMTRTKPANKSLNIASQACIILSSFGVLIYIMVGIMCILLQHNFLDYYAISQINGQIVGIFLVETGVAITVCASTLVLYNEFCH
jgi:multicomponent Na+:H+ antiporter subunit B